MLPVGYAIIKLAERYYRPFLVHVPLAEIKGENVSDQYIVDRMREKIGNLRKFKLFNIKGKKEKQRAEELEKQLHHQRVSTEEGDVEEIVKKKPKPLVSHLQVDLVTSIEQLLKEGMAKAEVKEYLKRMGYNITDINNAFRHVEVSEVELLSDENKFLTLVKQYPNITTTALYKKTGLSMRKCNDIKKKLVSENLIEVVEDRSEKGWKKYLRITQKGLEFVES